MKTFSLSLVLSLGFFSLNAMASVQCTLLAADSTNGLTGIAVQRVSSTGKILRTETRHYKTGSTDLSQAMETCQTVVEELVCVDTTHSVERIQGETAKPYTETKSEAQLQRRATKQVIDTYSFFIPFKRCENTILDHALSHMPDLEPKFIGSLSGEGVK